jgi:hypothetical protein
VLLPKFLNGSPNVHLAAHRAVNKRARISMFSGMSSMTRILVRGKPEGVAVMTGSFAIEMELY